MTESKELTTIEQVSDNALAVFTGEINTLDDLLKQIEKEALSLIPDTTTLKGRDAIRSNAANVAKSKVRIDKEGKLLADKQKEIPKLIDASRKKAREFLEILQEKVRAPLTAYELAQKQAEEEAERIAKKLLEAEQALIKYLSDWDNAIFLNEKFDFEKEKAEVAAKAKAELDEKTRIEREAWLIEQGRLQAEQAAKNEIERLEREAKRAEDDRKQRDIDEDNRRVFALEKAEIDRLKAIENERLRAEKEVADKKAVEDKKAANKRYQEKINNEIKAALIDNGFSEDEAVKIITLAVSKKLGNLIINY